MCFTVFVAVFGETLKDELANIDAIIVILKDSFPIILHKQEHSFWG
jgi:hypothetical protein